MIKLLRKLCYEQCIIEGCIGYWCGGEAKVKSYFVEIDIPDKVFSSNECSISKEDDKINIVGFLEDYEDDGFATLRMNDNLVCFETIFIIK